MAFLAEPTAEPTDERTVERRLERTESRSAPFACGTARDRCTEPLRGEADCVCAFGLRSDVGAETAAVCLICPVCPVGSTGFCVRVASPMA